MLFRSMHAAEVWCHCSCGSDYFNRHVYLCEEKEINIRTNCRSMHRIMKKGENMRLFFTKMHGLGNDYIYMDGFDSRMSKPAAWPSEQKGRLAVMMSRRHTGIGADGLIFIQPSEEAAFRMEMYNADGSRGAMCGNGIRCAARYAYDHGISTNQSFQVQTDSGIMSVYIRKTDEGEHITSVRVDMGVMANLGEQRVLLKAKEEWTDFTGGSFPVQYVSAGNRHCIFFVENVEAFPLKKAAELIHTLPGNEDGVNVEAAAVEKIAVTGEKYIKMRVVERGSGETMACGTGACAVTAAAVWQGYCRYDENVEVRQPGGILTTAYLADGRMLMEGPTEYVFEGYFDIPIASFYNGTR